MATIHRAKNGKVMFNGIEMDAHDIEVTIQHEVDSGKFAEVDEIINRGTELEATVKLTPFGKRFMKFIREATGEAAQAGFMIVHKGRGRYILQRYPYGKRGNKRNIYPYVKNGRH